MIKLNTSEPKKEESRNNDLGDKKDINHIWDEVNESTTGIFLHYCMKRKNKDSIYRLFTQPEPFTFIKGLASEKEFRERYPNFVMINLFDYAPNTIDSLKGIPQNLPHLSILDIISHEFRSLEGLPKDLPNLKKLSINGISYLYFIKNSPEFEEATRSGAPLLNLKGLPNSLPNLENLFINNTQITDISDLPSELPSLKTFVINISHPSSFKGSLNPLRGLPDIFPSLENFHVSNCCIQTLKYIPSSLAKLKRFIITGCPLRNRRHFRKNVPLLEELTLFGNGLTSLEGLANEFPLLKKLNLKGNNLTSLKYFPELLPDNTKIEIINNPLRSLCYLNHDTTFRLMLRFRHYQGFDMGSRFDEFVSEYLVPYERINENTGEMEIGQKFNLLVINQLQDYYRKTTTELIQQFISNPDSINEGELERIIWEANIQDRNALELNFPSDNVVIQKINKRLKFALHSGHFIFK